MKIGELSRKTGVAIETIRYYEHEGLLPAPARSEGNFRQYAPEHADRLLFIRHSRQLGMALDEIRLLLRFKDAPDENCRQVNSLIDEHIGHVSARIKELRLLEQQLQELRERCLIAQDAGHCGILQGLSGSPNAPDGLPTPATDVHGKGPSHARPLPSGPMGGSTRRG